MNQQAIYFVVGFDIKDGKLDAFKKIGEAMIAATQKEPGALGYEWHFSDDHKSCRLLETYADQNAVNAHLTGEAVRLIPGLLESAAVSGFEVYGDPGPEAARTLKNFGAVLFERWRGLHR